MVTTEDVDTVDNNNHDRSVDKDTDIFNKNDDFGYNNNDDIDTYNDNDDSSNNNDGGVDDDN